MEESAQRPLVILACLAMAACEPHPGTPAGNPDRLLGYTDSSSSSQKELEERFRSGVDAQSISALHRPLSERPHPAGSAATAALVKHLRSHAERLRSRRAGPRVPGAAVATALGDDHADGANAARDSPHRTGDRRGSHVEAIRSSAAATSRTRHQETPPAQVVFVNYGLPADYDEASRGRHLGEGPHRARALRAQPSRREGSHRAARGRRVRVNPLQRSGGRWRD